ncbi:unnamed protein product [Urochloa decumbens]|uniref:CCHC-type domain-containing protein n=1 Tax=Urochloa decumbens TaxID=240449 RepID=A0ABC9AM56_9POAL
MVDKTQWPVVDPGFEMLPPKLERAAGRPKVKRIKRRDEPGTRGPYQCKRCYQFGHIEKGCSAPPTELAAELPPSFPTKKGKRKGEAATSNPKHAAKKSKKGDAGTSNPKKAYKKSKKGGATSTSTSLVTQAPGTASTSTSIAIQAPTSPGVTTRSMAASISTPTRPPTTPVSPGPTTRRMAAQMDISPGGIARRIIIN